MERILFSLIFLGSFASYCQELPPFGPGDTCSYTVHELAVPCGDHIFDGVGVTADCPMDDYHFVIYNRWGEVMFESTKPAEFWDLTIGKDKLRAEDGVYVWLLTFIDVYSKKKELKGQVTVIR